MCTALASSPRVTVWCMPAQLGAFADASFGEGFDSFNITKAVGGGLRLVQSGGTDADTEWGTVHVCDCLCMQGYAMYVHLNHWLTILSP